MVKIIEKNKFNFFIGCDLIGFMFVFVILFLELFIVNDIKEIILIWFVLWLCLFCLELDVFFCY